jgi:sarcosine oxidase subunit beta
MNRSLPSRANAVIVGGGIVGVSIAYYLAKKGMSDVLLLERAIMGEGSTGKCAGGIRTQYSNEINIRFSLLSRSVFDGFQEEFGIDPEFHQVGYLFLAGEEKQIRVLEADAKLNEKLGVEIELLPREEVAHRWPFLRTDDLSGGSYTPKDGYAGPYEVLKGFISGARRLGAVLKEGVEVTAIHVKGGKVRAAETTAGDQVSTPVVVNAAGPYGARVAAMAGLDLPIRPLRRQIFFTEPFGDLPNQIPMVIDLQHGWYMRREGHALLLAGPQDTESSFNEQVDLKAQQWAAVRSMHRVPVLERARIAKGGWAGLYEISPDHNAILGEFPELRGFFCANGFSGHGFQHSPAAGILIAELIVEGRAKTLDIYPFRPQRFREDDLIPEPLTAFKE